MFLGMPLDWVTRHSAGAVRQGVVFESLMADSFIDLRHGDNRDSVTPAQYLLLCMNTAVGVEDAAHGLAREGISPAFSAIGLRAMIGCDTLESAILAVQKLYGLASPSFHMNLAVQNDHAVLSVAVDSRIEADAAILEDTYLSWMFMHCMYFLGRPMPVMDVVTRDPTHFNLGRRHYAIGAPLRHGRTTSMRFPKPLLAARSATRASDNAHWECFRLWLEFVETDWTGHQPAAYIPGVPLPLIEMAKRSGVSTSTLRRRMQPSGGGFRQSRQRAMIDAALNLLSNSDASVEAIASELGYADARSFRRFVKSGTGKTPQDLRLQGLDEAQANEHVVRRRLKEIGLTIGV